MCGEPWPRKFARPSHLCRAGSRKSPKALVEELKSLSSSIQSQEPNVRRAVAEEVRSAVASLQSGEQKAPKALVEELKSLSSSIQSQEPNVRRAVAEEVRAAVASLQSGEQKAPKTLIEELSRLARPSSRRSRLCGAPWQEVPRVPLQRESRKRRKLSSRN